MKNAKKLLALLLALAMCVGLLAGCGNDQPAASDPGTDNSTAPSESGEDANETTPLVVATEQGLEGRFKRRLEEIREWKRAHTPEGK